MENEYISSLLYLRQSGDWLFASWKEDGDPEELFRWGRIENRAMEDRGRVILVWLPNFEKFSALVQRGELPGGFEWMEKQKWLILGHLLPRHYRVMRDHEQEMFFKGNEPIVLVRLAKQ